jgi:hypothetical protein
MVFVFHQNSTFATKKKYCKKKCKRMAQLKASVEKKTKEPTAEEQKGIEKFIQLMKETFASDAMNGPEMQKRIFDLDTNKHVFMFIWFNSIESGIRAMKMLKKSTTRNLEITSQHLAKFMQSGENKDIRYALRVNGTKTIQRQLIDSKCEEMTTSLAKDLVMHKEGGVAWMFELPYNTNGDVRLVPLFSFRTCVPIDRPKQLFDTIKQSQGEGMANAIMTRLALRDEVDFKPTKEQSVEFLSLLRRRECRSCKSLDAPLICSKCKTARYCSKECQVKDWKNFHKKFCALEHLLGMGLLADI